MFLRIFGGAIETMQNSKPAAYKKSARPDPAGRARVLVSLPAPRHLYEERERVSSIIILERDTRKYTLPVRVDFVPLLLLLA